MLNFARVLICGSTLLLALVVVAASTQNALAYDDKEVANAQKDLLEMAKLIEAGKPVADKAVAAKKKYEELNTIMHAHKPKTRKGLGVEQLFLGLGKRVPTGAALDKMKAEYKQAAYVNLAIAEITNHYAPTRPKNGKGAKEWKQYNEDMVKATKELIKAVDAGKAADIKKAAANINNACNECHSTFRD